MSSVKTIPLAGAPPSTRFTLKIAFSTTPARESIVAVTKSTASRARSKLLTLNFDISQLPSLRNRAMAGWSAGYRAARVRRQLTPGPISSLRRTAGSPPVISFSTNYRELDSAVRPPVRRIGKRREEYFAVAQAASIPILEKLTAAAKRGPSEYFNLLRIVAAERIEGKRGRAERKDWGRESGIAHFLGFKYFSTFRTFFADRRTFRNTYFTSSLKSPTRTGRPGFVAKHVLRNSSSTAFPTLNVHKMPDV